MLFYVHVLKFTYSIIQENVRPKQLVIWKTTEAASFKTKCKYLSKKTHNDKNLRLVMLHFFTIDIVMP